MLNFCETKLAKEEFKGAKKPLNIWDVNINNIVVSQLISTKTHYKYLIRYLDKVIRLLLLILPKMSGYVKKIKLKMKTNIKPIN